MRATTSRAAIVFCCAWQGAAKPRKTNADNIAFRPPQIVRMLIRFPPLLVLLSNLRLRPGIQSAAGPGEAQQPTRRAPHRSVRLAAPTYTSTHQWDPETPPKSPPDESPATVSP